MGILERGGKVRTTVVSNGKKKALQAEVRKHVEAGSALYTDALLSYDGLAGDYALRLSITLLSILTVAPIRTDWRTTGAC